MIDGPMPDGYALAGGLVRELVAHNVIASDPALAEAGTVGVHVSFARSELDAVLVKTWEDDQGRVHVVARWKPA